MSMDQSSSTPCIVEEGQSVDSAPSLTSITIVANLVDAFLADVDPNMNLKFSTLSKFVLQS